MTNQATPLRFATRAAICVASILVALLILSANASAQLDTFSTGDGHESSVTFSGTTTLNYVAPLNAAASAGASSVTIGTVRNGSSSASQTRFEANRLVLIVQSSGYPAGSAPSGTQTDIDLTNNDVGRWELARIGAGYTLGSSTVPLTAPLENSFASTGAQVIAVPEYTTVSMAAGNTLTGHAWNGSSGGVIAFLANGTVSISGAVNADGLGFRGGLHHNQITQDGCTGFDDPVGGGKGEGIVLGAYGASYKSRGNIANGAGGGNCHNAGGGGGGNGGRGGIGGRSWDGGAVVGGLGGAELTYSTFDHALFGGGGGAGQANNNVGGVGGAGGGFVFMRGASLSGTSTISARGTTGGTASNDGAGGGGAGGVVYARFTGAANCTLASVAGGNGGNAGVDHGPAGGGAGGRMVFQRASGTCASSVSNGVAGVNTGGSNNFGAGPPATNDGTSSGGVDTTSGGLTVPTAAVTDPANAAVVNTAAPTLSGSGTVDATIRVSIDGSFVGTTTVGGGGTWSYTPVSPISAGAHNYTVTPVFQGIVGSATVSRSLTVDLTGPTVNITDPPALTNSSASQNIAFTTSDNIAVATVQCRVDAGSYAACTSLYATGTLGEGLHTIYVRATDSAGNTTTQSVTTTVDTTVPAAPTITGGPTGTVNTTGANFTFTAAEPGGSLQCQIDGGSWMACTSPAAYSGLTDATHTFSVRQVDAAGNTGSVASRSWTVDSAAPAAPAIAAPADGTHTSDSTPQFSGSAESSSLVRVYRDGVLLGSTTADSNGDWAFTPGASIVDGTYDFTATAEDSAGNVSAASNATELTIDTSAPAAPAIASPIDGAVIADTTPLITGTTEPGATVTVNVDGSPAGATVADSNGDWSFTPNPALAEGQYEISASATDVAGNGGASSAAVGITIDQTAPTAPLITGPADGTTTSDATPAISGSAEPNSTVSVYRDAILMGTADADSNGDWAFTPSSSLADATYAITARAADAAGNASADSNAVDVSIDTTAPSAPVVSTPADGSFTVDTMPTISGSAEANSTVAVSIDGGAAVDVTADGSGDWTYAPATPLTDGARSVTATATDAANNTSVASAATNFTVDTTAPNLAITSPTSNLTIGDNTPSITYSASDANSVTAECALDGEPFAACTSPYTATALDDGSHTVSVRATDAAGNLSQQSVTFTVDTIGPGTSLLTVPAGDNNADAATFEFAADEPGATFECSVDAGSFSACTAPFNLTGLSDGPHSFAVRSMDAVGNADATPATHHWTVDTAAPANPTIDNPADGTSVADTTPTISGNAEAGSTVTILIDGSSVGTSTADVDGEWTFTVPTALADGTYAFTATAEDTAGNVSIASPVVDVTIDTVAPDTTITTQPPAATSDAAATLEFTADEPVSRFECSLDGAAFTTCTSPLNLTGLADGNHTAEVRAVDIAGNTDASRDSYTWNIDSTAPTGPVITGPTEDQETNDTTPALSGTAEPNSTVTVYVDGNPIGTVTANGGGNWNVNALTLTDGPHTVHATAEDALGNVSVPSTTINFVVDTVEPTGSVTEQPGTGGPGTPPTFVIVSNDAGATVRCAIDGGAAVVCTTPYTPTGLGPGNHTLVVSFTDSAGNTATRSANFMVPGVVHTLPADPPTKSPAVGSADPLPAACFPKGITIYELKVVGSKLQIRGFARSQYIGKEVSINFQPTKSKAIAKTRINGDGSFFVTTKAPKKSLRRKGTTRYRAVVDGESSLWFKLDRRMGSNLASYSGGKLNVSGLLTKPLAAKATLSVTVRSGCSDPWTNIGKVKINARKGTFSASLPYSTSSRVLFVRMSAKVRKSAKGKATLTTYSFVIPVITDR